jgi:hypothetical protein
MKSALLSIVCLYTTISLSLAAFAQDQSPPKKHELRRITQDRAKS